jgi:hypothetical protein
LNLVPTPAPSSSANVTGTPAAATTGSNLTIATPLPGDYSIPVTVTDALGHSVSRVFTLHVALPAAITTENAFQDCIGASGDIMGYSSTCQLAPKYDGNGHIVAYEVPFHDSYGGFQYHFVIGRSDLTITGSAIGGNADTTLRRVLYTPNPQVLALDYSIMAPASTARTTECPFCPIDSGTLPITRVTISNFTFDGNRYGDFGTETQQPLHCNLDPNSIFKTQETFNDLYLGLGGVFWVRNSDFINSPDTALSLGADGSNGLPGHYSTVSYCNFGQGGFGIRPQGGDPDTESAPQTATRATAIMLKGNNTRAISNNISYAGTSPIAFNHDQYGGGGGNNQWAYWNTMFQNRYEMSDGIPGGMVASYGVTVHATIAANSVDGNHWPPDSACATRDGNGNCLVNFETKCPWVPPPTPQGDLPKLQANACAEISGTGHGLYNNELKNCTGGGMAVNTDNVPTQSVTISSTNPLLNGDAPRFIENNDDDGIVVFGKPNFIPVSGITLDAVMSQSNCGFGISLRNVLDSNNYVGFINGSCISGNALPGTNPNLQTGCVGTSLTGSADGSSRDVFWCSENSQPTNHFPASYTQYQPPSNNYNWTACPTVTPEVPACTRLTVPRATMRQ